MTQRARRGGTASSRRRGLLCRGGWSGHAAVRACVDRASRRAGSAGRHDRAGRLGRARVGRGGGAATLPGAASLQPHDLPGGAHFEELVAPPRAVGRSAPRRRVRELEPSDPGTTRLPDDPVVVGYQAPWALEMEVALRFRARSTFRTADGWLLDKAHARGVAQPGEPYVAEPSRPGRRSAALRDARLGVDDIPEPGGHDPPRALRAGYRRSTSTRSAAPPRASAPTWCGATRSRSWRTPGTRRSGSARSTRLLARTRLALEVGLRRELALEGLRTARSCRSTAGAHARLAGGVAGRTVKGRAQSTRRCRPASCRRLSGASAGLAARSRAPSPPRRRPGGRDRADDGGVRGQPQRCSAYDAGSPLRRRRAGPRDGVGRRVGGETWSGSTSVARTGDLRRAPRRARRPRLGAPIDSVFGQLDHVASGLGIAVSLDAELDLAELADVVARGDGADRRAGSAGCAR